MKNNVTEHNTSFYKQLRETAIGTKMAAPYAIIIMGDLEEKILKDCDKKPLTWWRYIDDIFMLWQHREKELEKFLEFLNCYHPTIKYTVDYSREEMHFLDVSVRKTNNQLATDLYIKPTSVMRHACHASKSAVVNMEGKILKAIQYIRLKCKKRVTSQNIFSFLNKGASIVDAELFHEVLNKMEIEGYIFKKGRGKNASFFVKRNLIDNNKNIVLDAFSTENSIASPLQQENISSPVTVANREAFIDSTYNNLPSNTPNFSQVKTPTKDRGGYILQQINSQRHSQSSTDLFLQDEIVFLREELVNKQNTIDKLLQVLTVDSKTIKCDKQKISHKSCQINLLTEKYNSNDKTINICNDFRECVVDQSNKTKEISTQTEHEQNYADDELLNNTSCDDDVLANKNKKKNAEAKINLENQLKEIRHIKHQNYTNNPSRQLPAQI